MLATDATLGRHRRPNALGRHVGAAAALDDLAAIAQVSPADDRDAVGHGRDHDERADETAPRRRNVEAEFERAGQVAASSAKKMKVNDASMREVTVEPKPRREESAAASENPKSQALQRAGSVAQFRLRPV